MKQKAKLNNKKKEKNKLKNEPSTLA